MLVFPESIKIMKINGYWQIFKDCLGKEKD